MIAADLTQPWSHLLLAQGYQSDLPSVWLLKGLLMYLTEPEVYDLLKPISELRLLYASQCEELRNRHNYLAWLSRKLK